MQNLNQLLLESPDVTDKPTAKALTYTQTDRQTHTHTHTKNVGVGVSFQEVYFNYPEQPEEMGLKGVSFEVAPGTTTGVCVCVCVCVFGWGRGDWGKVV
jgi:ABC-type multidrug transport system fused ATPase/permease subunit